MSCLSFMVEHPNGFAHELKIHQRKEDGFFEIPCLQTAFKNAAIILNYNRIFLHAITPRIENWYREGSSIGDIFLNHAEFFRVCYSIL